MTNVFVKGIASNFERALRLLEAALGDCPEELWTTDLWPVEAPTGPTPHGGLHGSAPWFLGYHALTTLDYDLTAEVGPWTRPRPFDENTYSFPNRVFTKIELLGYVDYCRGRVDQTLEDLTEKVADQVVPPAHRHHGMLFGVLLGSVPLHVIEHAEPGHRGLLLLGGKLFPRCRLTATGEQDEVLHVSSFHSRRRPPT